MPGYNKSIHGREGEMMMNETTTLEKEERWAEYTKSKPWLHSIGPWEDYEEGELFVDFLMKRSSHNYTDDDRQKINEIILSPFYTGDTLLEIYEDLDHSFNIGLRDHDFTVISFMIDCLLGLVRQCNEAMKNAVAGPS